MTLELCQIVTYNYYCPQLHKALNFRGFRSWHEISEILLSHHPHMNLDYVQHV